MKLYKLLYSILFLVPFSINAQQILLPVEVLGEEGKTVSRTFDLSPQEAENSKRLWLQVNNLGYENKASIKINNGAWYDLNNASVDMQAQEKARGGMVHGGFNTIRFSIPATSITPGSNTISFRFNTSDAISNGYRVVRFNLLDNNSKKILAPTRFIEDNPDNWEAPFTDANSIAEGKDLWYNASLKSNYLPAGRKGFWYAHEIGSEQPINAKCSSCHTQDGRDLELFSYSNEAIVERAKFHQLTEVEGQKIASYIRSLSEEHDNVGRYGRPWNPPYQPGPALDTMPIEKWAAGAGLDAVLDEDKDMLPYLFPNGVNQEEVYNRFDSDKSFDRTLIPLAIQFPDWKHWLPMVHPSDAYNKNNYYLDPNTGPNNPNKNYQELRQYLETNAPLGFPNKVETLNKIKTLHHHFRFFVEQGATKNEHWRSSDGDATKNLNDGVSREIAATSLARLFAVKNFEFVQEFNLQNKAAEFSNYPEETQPRQWPGDEYNVFEVPPHFQACVNNNCNQFMGQPTETGMYESTAWYQMQMVINGGDGFISHNSPVDYNYHPDFITKACNSSGVNEPLRYYHSMNVMYQTRTWDGGTSPNNGKGFRIRVMGPWNIYGITDGNQFNGFAPGEFAKTLEKVTPGMTAWVLNAQLRQFLTEVQKPQNDLSLWNRTPDGDDNTLDRADKTYNDIIDAVQRTERQETFFVHYAAKMYYYIPRFQKLGVDCEIMEEVIDWCQEAWPLIDWHVFSNKGEFQFSLQLDDDNFCAASNAITALATNVTNNTTYNWTINGNASSETSSQLTTDNLQEGDIVICQVSSNKTCLIDNTVEASFTMPSKGYSFSMRKVGSSNFTPLESTFACTNDQIELKLDIDIQPKQWLDAMDVNVGTEPTDNSMISTWNDKSGNGFIAEANQTGLQPKYKATAMNGLPAVYFGDDNNADGLELFNTTEDDFMDGDWTIILVGKTLTNGNTDWRDMLGNKTEGNNGWFYRFGGSDARVQIGIGPTLQHGKGYNFDRSFIAQITKDGDVITTYLNGISDRVITKDQAVSMTINEALYLGQSSNGNPNTNRYHVGPIAELMVFEHAITTAEQLRLEGYLTNKWKLNEELTYTHPYATTSPFSFNMDLPNGELVNFDPIQSTNTITLDQTNKFGEYTINKHICNGPVNNFTISNNGATLENMIQYSVNGATPVSGNTLNAFEDDQIQLSPSYNLSGDYQWEEPTGNRLSLNINPSFNTSISNNNDVWILHVLPSDCNTQEEVFEIKIHVTEQTNQLVHILKNDTPTFGVDGGGNGANGQSVKLWDEDGNNINQQWIELDRGNGFYSYQKKDTDFCIDANEGGANGQLLTLQPCNATNGNQQWKKIEVGTNIYRLEKSNAPSFSIDGGAGSINDQQLKLWSSDDNNVNQHWLFSNITDLVTSLDDAFNHEILLYPNPANNTLTIQGIKEGSQISILSIEGKIEQEFIATSTSQTELNIEELNAGTYIIMIENNISNNVLKFNKL